MSSAKHWEQDKDATLYVGNLDERAKEELIFELFSQVGRVSTVHAPLDRVSRTHQGYAFVEFITAEDADYAAKVMNGIKLYGRPLKVNKSNADKEKQADIGAELFIGNLDSVVDEKMLYDTFSRFGALISNPKVRTMIQIGHNPFTKIFAGRTRREQPFQGLWLRVLRQL
jgi:splicing factor 3B subunit 4